MVDEVRVVFALNQGCSRSWVSRSTATACPDPGLAPVLADSFAWWLVAGLGLGLGTAMVYPTLLAVVGDVAHPSWRARAVGVYRLWRDLGFAVGALLTGILADLWGIRGAIWIVAALTAASGLVVALRMYETHPPARR